MRVFITGSEGQVGQELGRVFSNVDTFLATHEAQDITHPSIIQTIVDFKPDALIHTGAFTDVDGCELDPDRAFRVNAFGTRNVAVGAEKVKAKLVYLSTDYVFDGEKREPYTEFDETNPINIYGKSKLAGEWFVQHLSSRFFIIRTSWLYGRKGKNFLKTVLRLAQEKEELRMVDDQKGSPTNARELSEVIGRVIKAETYGIYHASGAGESSWYEYALEILRLKGIKKKVVPIKASQLGWPAQRPAYSVLRHRALESIGIQMRPWQEALKEFILTDG
ncbi:MAG: dTDP-4-dehydrorhamnose reductase [Deltaproteobacteria bacterium]|nr:dTDP-4-dehydrorhamnose reductase [Deltaproteobacteria bacterium]